MPTSIDDTLYWEPNPERVNAAHRCPICADHVTHGTSATGVSRCCCHVIHVDCARRLFSLAGALQCAFCRCTDFDREFPRIVERQPSLENVSESSADSGYWQEDVERDYRHTRCPVCSQLFDDSTIETGVSTCCYRTIHLECARRSFGVSRSHDCPVCGSSYRTDHHAGAFRVMRPWSNHDQE